MYIYVMKKINDYFIDYISTNWIKSKYPSWELGNSFRAETKCFINRLNSLKDAIKNRMWNWLFASDHQMMKMIHHRMSKYGSPFQRELQKRSPLTSYMACTQNKWDFCKAAVWGKDVFHSILAAMERKETDASETRLWLNACYNRYVIQHSHHIHVRQIVWKWI